MNKGYNRESGKARKRKYTKGKCARCVLRVIHDRIANVDIPCPDRKKCGKEGCEDFLTKHSFKVSKKELTSGD